MSLKTSKKIRTSTVCLLKPMTGNAPSDVANLMWVTVSTTSWRWEAELMQQILTAHAIAARVVTLGGGFYMGQGSPAALQVLLEDQQTALNLLKPVEETETIE